MLLRTPAVVDVDAETHSSAFSGPPGPTVVQPADSWEDEADTAAPESLQEDEASLKLSAPRTSTANIDDGTDDGGVSDGSSGADGSPSQARPARAGPLSQDQRVLLLQVADKSLADLLWELRLSLQELVDLIIGEPPFRLPQQVGAAFVALRELLLQSYELHRDDPTACTVISAPRATGIDLEMESEGYVNRTGCADTGRTSRGSSSRGGGASDA